MIYWTDVKKTLLKYCPPEASGWDLKRVVTYLNKEERLSMQRIASMTEGKCGRTSLCMMVKRLS